MGSRADYYRQWKERNRERVREYKRARVAADREKYNAECLAFYYRNKDRHMEGQRIYRKTNPEKFLAHQAVAQATRTGVLVKEPCEKCGYEKGEAHHDDYSKPLEVRWLCRVCHGKEHRAS